MEVVIITDYIVISKEHKRRLMELNTLAMMDQQGLGYPGINETAFLYTDADAKLIGDKEYITKRDIMIIFDVADKKALAILKLMQQVGMAVQLGKEYYTSRKKLDQFIEEQMGNTIVL